MDASILLGAALFGKTSFLHALETLIHDIKKMFIHIHLMNMIIVIFIEQCHSS